MAASIATSLHHGCSWAGAFQLTGGSGEGAKAMTGTNWNGHRFFGLRTAKSDRSARAGRRGGHDDVASADVGSRSIKESRAAHVRGSREIREIESDTLRRLHPGFDRTRPGAGVQLARQSAGGVGGLSRASSPPAPRDRPPPPPRAAPSRSPARRAYRARCRDCFASPPSRAARVRASVPPAPRDRPGGERR